VVVLAELGRIWWTWQNMVECRQIAADCRLVVGLWLLSWWKQVDVYKVSRGCPVTLAIYLPYTNKTSLVYFYYIHVLIY
jgi:hypothetical protein